METPPQSSSNPPEPKRGVVNTLIVGAIGLFSAIYLLNPTFGIDFIPDNLPIIGNLDEATAAALLISALAYFGVDLGRLFGKAREYEKRPKPDPKAKTTVDAEFVER